MDSLVSQTAEMLAMLPENEVLLINELVKHLIKEWDPDFTKVTSGEAKVIDKSDKKMKSGDYYSRKMFGKMVFVWRMSTCYVLISAFDFAD